MTGYNMEGVMGSGLTRKQFLASAAFAGIAGLASRPARAARRSVIKFGIDLPADHPTTLHVKSAADKIKSATNGEVTVQIFPNNELGDDTHMLSNLRAGAMQMMGIGDNILATLVPAAAIDNVGFAFKDAKTAWAALDGGVGALVRPEIEKTGLYAMEKVWDEGFRQVTTSTKPINTPEDLQGFKIRVPPSPMNLSIFKDLGAAPVTMNVSELYTALQTKVVDGQENPLGVIETTKFYQVQKYCSMTNHMWVGYWMIMNGPFWKSMPAAHQQAVSDAFNTAADSQRTANEALDSSLESKLKSQGLIFNTPDPAAFKAQLVKAGYYKEWQGKFGNKLWSALEKFTGTLG
jgi:TRAP-type transport system periplasmic protein